MGKPWLIKFISLWPPFLGAGIRLKKIAPDYGKMVRCDCRKPNPGMLLKAAEDFDIDLTKSIMIGDKDLDILVGKRAGCKSFLVEEVDLALKDL